ncbi:MAG: SCO family protein [Candidatus Sulfotelmatobacter sp.]
MNNHTRRIVLLALILATTVLVSSCHSAKTPPAKRYPFTGRVVAVDTQSQSAIIDGDAIPGFMEAMAMPYKVKPEATLNHLHSGDSISAEVVVVQPDPKNEDAAPDYWLENVKTISRIDAVPAAGANSLHVPAPGEDVPDFSFTNQSGKRISLQQFRGNVLFLTFIYTRCPFPDFCPRMSSHFAEIYKQMGTNPGLAGAHLLSISFDPEHDTPKVLRDYGFSVAHTHELALFTHWEFAAPSKADLPKIADFFALTVTPENGLITHNLSTAVIGPDGKIVKWYHGSDWQPSDLIKDAAAAPAH